MKSSHLCCVLLLTLFCGMSVSCSENEYVGPIYEGIPFHSVFPTDSSNAKVIFLEELLENRNSSLSYEDYLDCVDYIPLETSSQSIIPEVKYCIVSDRNIYLCSGMKDNTIVIFDLNGQFINAIRPGRGPGELQELHGAFFSSKSKELIVLSFPTELSFYSPEGVFLRKEELPFYADAVAQLEDGYIFSVYSLLSKNNLDERAHLLIRTDSELNEISRSVPFYSYFGSEVPPFPVSDIEYQSFYSRYQGRVYLYDGEIMHSHYQFDVGKYSIPSRDLYDMDSYSIIQYLNDHDVCELGGGYYETETHLFLTGSVNPSYLPIFVDKFSQNVIGSAAFSINIPFMFPIGTCGSKFVSLIHAYWVSSIVKNCKEGGEYNKDLMTPETLSELEKVQADDNPVLIMYKMKHF